MPYVLLILLSLMGVWLVSVFFVLPITLFFRRYWPQFAYESEPLLFWGGLLFSGVGMVLLSIYLLLKM